MKHFNTTFLLLLICFKLPALAQEKAPVQEKYTAHNKGKLFISWGGNRDYFTDSNIHFKGTDYDFTLYDVKAHDVPVGFNIDYINPLRMSIPQTDFKLGYFICDHYNISVGADHMKYVMTQDQVAHIGGAISANYPNYAGIYTDETMNSVDLTDGNFLKFEHTNGLNYININAARYDDISKLFRLPNTDKVQVNLTEGVGTGFLFPRTDATLLGKERHDEFNVAGYGLDAKVGMNVTFFKYFYIQGEIKCGYINMQHIRTTVSTSDSASQDFYFLQKILSLGAIIRL